MHLVCRYLSTRPETPAPFAVLDENDRLDNHRIREHEEDHLLYGHAGKVNTDNSVLVQSPDVLMDRPAVCHYEVERCNRERGAKRDPESPKDAPTHCPLECKNWHSPTKFEEEVGTVAEHFLSRANAA